MLNTLGSVAQEKTFHAADGKALSVGEQVGSRTGSMVTRV
jgi:hypothetical protein